MAPNAATAFMPFGLGLRSCIGRYFSLVESQVCGCWRVLSACVLCERVWRGQLNFCVFKLTSQPAPLPSQPIANDQPTPTTVQPPSKHPPPR
jgi:hypothetical protein